MITPLAPARGDVGPISALYGASRRKVLGISTARSFEFGFSFSMAKSTAALSFAESNPASAGDCRAQSSLGG
ncbi:hypothetical protein D3C83_212800 [compost metagenome]